jgi:hypothetical protein
LPSHLWLLHFLFIEPLNQDITDWANSWNNHKMQIPEQGTKSPADLRWFSMLQQGSRGFSPSASSFQPVEETLGVDEVPEYGIDWNAYQDARIQNHHLTNNPADPFPENPFVSHQPETFNMVNVDESRCPFTDDELNIFTYNLNLIPQELRASRQMSDRKHVWIRALDICTQIKSM